MILNPGKQEKSDECSCAPEFLTDFSAVSAALWLLRNLAGLEPVKMADGGQIDPGSTGLGRRGRLGLFPQDAFELAGIEPVTAAVRALIHFHAAFGAEKMALQLDRVAPGTIPFAGGINPHCRIAGDTLKCAPAAVGKFFDPLQLERVKPDATAAAVTDIQRDTSHVNFGQRIETCRAFHGFISGLP